MLVSAYPPPLLGEVTDIMSAQRLYDFFRSRLPSAISSTELRAVVDKICAKYVPIKGTVEAFSSLGMEGTIYANIAAGITGAFTYRDALTKAFNDMKADGWQLVPKNLAVMPVQQAAKPAAVLPPVKQTVAAVALPPAQQNEAGVTKALTTPSSGKKATSLDDLQAALDSISEMAPLITLARQQALAQKVVAASKKGQQFYVPVDQAKPNVWPWIVGALGVTFLLGAIVYHYAMPSETKP